MNVSERSHTGFKLVPSRWRWRASFDEKPDAIQDGVLADWRHDTAMRWAGRFLDSALLCVYGRMLRLVIEARLYERDLRG